MQLNKRILPFDTHAQRTNCFPSAPGTIRCSPACHLMLALKHFPPIFNIIAFAPSPAVPSVLSIPQLVHHSHTLFNVNIDDKQAALEHMLTIILINGNGSVI